MIVTGYEEHENEDYQLRELEDLERRKELNLICTHIVKQKWSDWDLTFNRDLSYLEQLGIQQILNADSFTFTDKPKNNEVIYHAWWD